MASIFDGGIGDFSGALDLTGTGVDQGITVQDLFRKNIDQPARITEPRPTPPPQQDQDVQLPGIFETTAEAIKFGAKNQVADLVQFFGTNQFRSEENRINAARKVDQMRLNAIDGTSDSYKKLLLSDRKDVPFHLSTTNDVASQLPLFVGAGLTTAVTRNPFAGGAAFTPTIFTGFYNDVLGRVQAANGKVTEADRKKAGDAATLNSLFAFVSESAIPQTGLLKGGTLMKRLMRVGLQEGMEEAIQGSFETTLKTYGWDDPKNLAGNLAEEVPPQIVAGFILGGGTAAAIPPHISQYTRGELEKKLRGKLERANKRVSKQRKDGKKMQQSQIDETVENLMGVYDIKQAFLQERFNPDKLVGQLVENPDLLKDIGFVETIKDGNKTSIPSPWPFFSKDTRRQAQDIAQSALSEVRFGLNKDKTYIFTKSKKAKAEAKERNEKLEVLPPHVQQIAKTKAAELIDEGLELEEIQEQMVKFYEEVGGLNNVYLSSIGKEQGADLGDISSSVPVFSFTYGHTTAGKLADELKLTQPELGKPFSILPKNLTIQGSTTIFDQQREAEGKTKSTIEGVNKAIQEAYDASQRAEVLPPEDEPGTDVEGIDPDVPLTPVDQPTAPVDDQSNFGRLQDFIINGVTDVEQIALGLGLSRETSTMVAKQIQVLQAIGAVELLGLNGATQYLETRINEALVYEHAELEVLGALVQGNIPNSDLFNTNNALRRSVEKAIPLVQAELERIQDGVDIDTTEEEFENARAKVIKQHVNAILSDAPSLVYPGLAGFVHDTLNDPQASGVFGFTQFAIPELKSYLNSPNLELEIGLERMARLELTVQILEAFDKGTVPQNTNQEAMEAVNAENRDTGRFDDFTAQGYANSNVTMDSIATSLVARIIAIRESIAQIFRNNPQLSISLDTNAGKHIIASDPTLQTLMVNQEALWIQLEETLDPIVVELLRSSSATQLDSYLTNRDMEMSEWNAAVAQFAKDKKPIVGFTSEIPINVKAVEAPAGQVQGVKSGTSVELNGPFVVDTTQAQEGKVLIKDGQWVWVTPSMLAKIINLSSFLSNQWGISSPVKTQWEGDQNIAMGGLGPPKPPGDTPTTGGYDGDSDDEHQKANFNQFKAQGDKDAHKPVELGDDKRPVPLRSFFKSLGFLKFPGMVKDYLLSIFGDPRDVARRREEKELLKRMSLSDQVMNQLFQDRFFQDLADQLALSQLEPMRRRLDTIVKERIAPKLNMDPKTADNVIQGLMQFAAEEIFSKKGNANAHSVTDIGAGGQHLSFEEGQAHVRWMTEFHQRLGLPFTPQDQVRWEAGRDQLAFFNILGQIDPELQAMLNYYKAEIEYPVLEAGLKVGLFKSANMWTNISRGFNHRLATKQPLQQSGSASAAVIRDPNIQGQNFRTMGEYADETEGFGLIPEFGFFGTSRHYIRDYVTYVQQAQSLQSLKGILANVPFKLRENQQAITGFRPTTEAQIDAIDDLIAQVALVEYTDSNTIKQIAQLTGQTEQSILTDLGFIQDPSTPGLAVWSGGKFSQPWVYRPLSDAFQSMFAPAGQQGLRKANAFFNFGKRFLTYNPYDATFLWLSAVLVNSSPSEFGKLFTDYSKLVLTDLPFVGKTGRGILKGEFFPVGDLDLEDYENLPLFIAKGFTGFGYHPAMAALWDDQQLGKFPSDLTTGERLSEYFKSFGGTNAAIFNTLIAQKLYGVIDKFYQKNLTKIDPS
ncbi:MAG: hypothetical protein ACW987_14720, partial [Candidatus Thorarchaeota archaeon]